MKLRISEEISEKTKYNLSEESLDGPFNFNIDDIESGSHLENLELPPVPRGKNRIRMIPIQYRRREPDWDVPNRRVFKKWTEEREVWIGAFEDVTGLFSDILAVRVLHESTDCSREASFPHLPESTDKGDLPENCLKRIKRAFGEVKDLFRIFGCQSWSVRKICPNRNV